MCDDIGKEEVYIPFREIKRGKKFLSILKSVCRSTGTSFPRFTFTVDKLDHERELNTERIKVIQEAHQLSKSLRDSAVNLLKNFGNMMGNAAEILAAGGRTDRTSIIKGLKDRGFL